MAGKCVNNGAKPKWTDEQMLDALKRVHAIVGFCGVSDYRRARLPTEPSSEAIAARFKRWNTAKLRAGLPIRVKIVVVRDSERLQDDEELLEATPLQEYPCWKCARPFKGLGRKKGQWHCEYCRLVNNESAANMAWLG